ncbi:unnamed protein product [Pleuronectes platessa]|uniref:Uncharacterized protein n=1 Tax=Pleuronectes platessa TaxID=8262 RepID=A0A9N7W2C7_PLEPL|nr:unnamed protein product [Pleuronectes platessa]
MLQQSWVWTGDMTLLFHCSNKGSIVENCMVTVPLSKEPYSPNICSPGAVHGCPLLFVSCYVHEMATRCRTPPCSPPGPEYTRIIEELMGLTPCYRIAGERLDYAARAAQLESPCTVARETPSRGCVSVSVEPAVGAGAEGDGRLCECEHPR